jgi:hypothetical protein
MAIRIGPLSLRRPVRSFIIWIRRTAMTDRKQAAYWDRQYDDLRALNAAIDSASGTASNLDRLWTSYGLKAGGAETWQPGLVFFEHLLADKATRKTCKRKRYPLGPYHCLEAWPLARQVYDLRTVDRLHRDEIVAKLRDSKTILSGPQDVSWMTGWVKLCLEWHAKHPTD